MNILIDATNIVPDSGGFIHLKENPFKPSLF